MEVLWPGRYEPHAKSVKEDHSEMNLKVHVCRCRLVEMMMPASSCYKLVLAGCAFIMHEIYDPPTCLSAVQSNDQDMHD